jgi:O-acetyl-ADP-ribose deacetylase (regulator of RNase III)
MQKEAVFGRTTLELRKGDITDLDVDAIVNPANSLLQLGGGVAGAIRRKGGGSIQEECNRIGGARVGEAVITTGGNLKARHVIHAVGPRNGEGDEERKLRNATLNSLKLADEKGMESIALPAVSTGIFGFPLDRCARVMLSTSIDYLKAGTGLRRVIYCLYDEAALRTFSEELDRLGT